MPETPSRRSRLAAAFDWLWPILLATCISLMSGRSNVPGLKLVGFDKVVHFLVFGLLATLIGRIDAVRRWPWLGIGWAVVLTSAFGIADEFHQSFTPGRSVEVADWVADTLGAAVAIACYAWWPWYRGLLEWGVGAGKRRIENPLATADRGRDA